MNDIVPNPFYVEPESINNITGGSFTPITPVTSITPITPVITPTTSIAPNYSAIGSTVGSHIASKPTFSLDSIVQPRGRVSNLISTSADPVSVPASSWGRDWLGKTAFGQKLLGGYDNAMQKANSVGETLGKTAGQVGTGFKALSTFDKISTGLNAVGSILDGLNTRKQLNLIKQQLHHNIANDNRNYEMAKRSYNSQLEDRQRYREAYWRANHANNPNSGIVEKPLTVNEYLTKYGA